MSTIAIPMPPHNSEHSTTMPIAEIFSNVSLDTSGISPPPSEAFPTFRQCQKWRESFGSGVTEGIVRLSDGGVVALALSKCGGSFHGCWTGPESVKSKLSPLLCREESHFNAYSEPDPTIGEWLAKDGKMFSVMVFPSYRTKLEQTEPVQEVTETRAEKLYREWDESRAATRRPVSLSEIGRSATQ